MKETKPNVVIDTSVFIAALTGSPTCRKIIRLLRNHKITLLISPALIDELSEVLLRPKFFNIITKASIKRLFRIIKLQAILIHPSQSVSDAPDPKDAIVLEGAIGAQADFLITGDKELLELGSYRDIKIISPGEFLKRFRRNFGNL